LALKEMPVEFHARAAGTFPLAGWVHNQVLVALDVQQGSPAGSRFSSTFSSSKASNKCHRNRPGNINSDVIDRELGQFIETSWHFIDWCSL